MPQLTIVQTHPIQYHAPIYRAVEEKGVDVTVIYGSDFSVEGYTDQEFGISFAWEVDLLSGYASHFLSRAEEGGARRVEDLSTRGLSKALRRTDPDAVLLTGYSPSFYWMSAFHALRMNCPLLFRAETTDHAVDRGWLKRALRDQMLRFLYRRCNRLLYIGERSRAHYRRLGVPEEKLEFSPYCVNTAPFRPGEEARDEMRTQVRSELRLSDDQFVLLFSGKLVPWKGPDLLLRAAKQLSAKLRRCLALVFVGDGEMRNALTKQSSEDLVTRFPGFKPQRELSRYYHAADALVLPSRATETWGLVVNEGLHHGLPCIVSDAVGSAPDLVIPSETGEIFPSDSGKHLSRAIERLVGWHDRSEQVRDRCRGHVREYSTERAAAGIVEAVRAVVYSESE